MSALPYSTATSGEKAIQETEKILKQFGCAKFGVMKDWEAGTLLIQFEWRGARVSFPANFKGYAAAYLKQNPWTNLKKSTRSEWEARALEQGSIAVCSILRDWIKAQVVAVETGLISFEEVFMAHVLLPSGQRMIEFAQAQKLLPNKADEQ